MYYVYDQNTGDYLGKVRSKRHLKRIQPPVEIETVIITDLDHGSNFYTLNLLPDYEVEYVS